MILPPHINGSSGRTAGGHQRRKRGNDEDQRQADAHAGQRQIAVAGDMADVDAVYNVVQHIYQLGDDCGDCQLPQQLAAYYRTLLK